MYKVKIYIPKKVCKECIIYKWSKYSKINICSDINNTKGRRNEIEFDNYHRL